LDDALREEIRKAALIGVRASLEEALRQELSEHLGFGWYERSGSGPKPAEAQRSGYFRRQVNTDHGEIPDLRVPKLRRGNKDREWKVLTRYQSCLQYVLDALLYIYMLGLSLRDLQEALYVLFGPLLSVSAINRVTRKVQETMQEWYQRPIEHTPPIILVDGVWVKILSRPQ
jgi:putative transposase